MQFEIEFEASHLNRILEVARREIASPDEMLGSIGESLLRVNRKRHEKGVDPEGNDWKALSPLTLAAGERKGGPLKKTGRMLASLNYQVSDDALILGFDGARDGKLAGFHHHGTDPYTIVPKNRKALAFAGIVTKRVNLQVCQSGSLSAFLIAIKTWLRMWPQIICCGFYSAFDSVINGL